MCGVYESIETGYYDRVFRKRSGVQSKWHFLKFEVLKRIIAEEEIENILDIACGPGTFIGSLPSGLDCTGIDFAEEQILYARKFYGSDNKVFISCDVNAGKLPFKDDSFDAVTCIEFFEHITLAEISLILKEVCRCLKPGGLFIATTPNYQLTWRILEAAISVLGKVDYRPQHITHFKLPDFRSQIEKAGLEILTARKYLYLSPFIAAINWKLSSLLFELEYNYFKGLGNSLLVVARNVEK